MEADAGLAGWRAAAAGALKAGKRKILRGIRDNTAMEFLFPIFFFWVLFAAFVASMASKRGRDPYVWFGASVLFSPLGAALILLMTGDPPREQEVHRIVTGELRRCPFCAEGIRPEAIVCKHCGRDVPALPVAPPPPSSPYSPQYCWSCSCGARNDDGAAMQCAYCGATRLAAQYDKP